MERWARLWLRIRRRVRRTLKLRPKLKRYDSLVSLECLIRPPKVEWETHVLLHEDYRSWCPNCVGAKLIALIMSCRKRKKDWE